jgi:hypothetical protein
MKMKMLRSSILCFVVLLLTAPLLSAQDLSKYRHFTLGMSLTRVLELRLVPRMGGPALHLYDASGEPRAWLLVTNEGQGLELRGPSGPAVIIATPDPRNPPSGWKSKRAAGRIRLFDHKGAVIWSAP